MRREESDQLVACPDCGADVSPATDRACAFGVSAVICGECSVRRGGSYDGDRESWTTPPRIEDLGPGELEAR